MKKGCSASAFSVFLDKVRLKKAGQFFLIAALIISGMVIGFGTLYNSAQIVRADTQVYDFSEELRSEVRQVHDSGTFSGLSEKQINENTEKLLNYYAEQNPDSDFIVLFGNTEKSSLLYSEGAKIHVSKPENEPEEQPNAPSGSTGIQSVHNTPPNTLIEKKEGKVEQTRIVEKKKVKIDMRYSSKTKDASKPDTPNQDSTKVSPAETEVADQKITREFDLSGDQNFYVIVRKKVNNEQVVIAG